MDLEISNRRRAEGTLAHLEEIRVLLPDVRRYIRLHEPGYWPEMVSVLGVVADEPLGPLATLPLASCAAVGGDPEAAVPAAAAWEVLNLGVRILDDLQDRDTPDGLWARVGVPRAFNFSAALYAFCNELLVRAAWPDERYRAVSRTFTLEVMRLAAGQDRDLRGETHTVDDYWATITDKNASAFALACAAGSLCGTSVPTLVDACRTFGHHLGLALQLFDDFEGLWEPPGRSDLEMGKTTLPVLYGLSVEHDRRDELRRLVYEGEAAAHADRVRAILEGIHAREFMIWTALMEREQAIAALAPCPGKVGVSALVAYVTAIFAHVEDILDDGGSPP
jgi:geranylgeranyl diphosphate synthase, type I